MRMRSLLPLLLAAGCSASLGGPTGTVTGNVAPLLERVLPGAPEPSPRFRALLSAGASALVASVEARGAAATFLLESRRDGVESWLSPDEVALQLRAGFLVGTRGLGGDMMSGDASQSAALVLAGREGLAERFHGFLAGDDRVALRSYVCEIASRGFRDIDIGNGPARTVLFQERCMNPQETFQNLYWLDPTRGEILQSRQWAGPLTGPIALRAVPR